MAQCSSCRFQNMPGVTHCGRCGASLMLRTATMNVHPPRATKWAKTWRRTPFARLLRLQLQGWRSLGQTLQLKPREALPPFRVLLRMVLPGWPQIASDQRYLGYGLLAGFCVCLTLGVLLLGSAGGALFLGLALTCHAASVYELAVRSTSLRSTRLSLFALGCGLLGLALYLPANAAVQQFAAPIQVQLDRPPLKSGDVLLVNHSAYRNHLPQAGQLVSYVLPGGDYLGRTANGYNARYRLRGQRLDRVLAEPGQKILWEGRKLTVDGRESPLLPLNPENLPIRLDLTVPPEHYLILPSTEQFNARVHPGDEVWKRWSLVAADNIEGRAYCRLRPWTRMGAID